MCFIIASDVVRTTLDIDEPILRELKTLAKRERKSLGRLASVLLAQALHAGNHEVDAKRAVDSWISKPMGTKVNLADSEALYSALDGEPQPATRVAEDAR
jgi:hypothetical protein